MPPYMTRNTFLVIYGGIYDILALRHKNLVYIYQEYMKHICIIYHIYDSYIVKNTGQEVYKYKVPIFLLRITYWKLSQFRKYRVSPVEVPCKYRVSPQSFTTYYLLETL